MDSLLRMRTASVVIIIVSALVVVAIVGALALIFGLGFGLGVYKKVSYEYYGLNYDTYRGTIEKKIYTEGLYDLGVYGQFILIPKIFKMIEFKDSTVNPLIQLKTNIGFNNSDIINYSFVNSFGKNNGTYYWNLNPTSLKLV